MKEVIEQTTRLLLNGNLTKEEADKILLDLHLVSFLLPNDDETEKRAEYMQKPRREQNEEFIYGFMQGADWIKGIRKPNES